eukprot:CAMPEP_0182556262 /NCGR_PEP_ID=MMETSP1324-20130603/586_1 /TAXON_ID=236786 /ORGANISM="Florenciella sp., Strain RCC1587" /LENGTH=43 /DNA_ID= /DNA_START= /DNA_END= /DNA_ORIENTATION=
MPPHLHTPPYRPPHCTATTMVTNAMTIKIAPLHLPRATSTQAI